MQNKIIFSRKASKQRWWRSTLFTFLALTLWGHIFSSSFVTSLVAAPANALSAQAATDIDLITNMDSAFDVVQPGDANSYTVTVENRGPSAATNPSWLVEVASAASISNINCTASGGATCPGTFNPQSINGIEGLNAVIPAIPVDSVITLTFDTVAKVNDGNFSADSYVIPNGQVDAYPETNDADINVSILPRLLSWGVTKTILRYEDSGGSTVTDPVPGGSVVYQIVVANNGVDDIVDLRLTEEMGTDEGTGTIPMLIAGTSVSGYGRNFYVGGTTMAEVTCTAANGATCPADQTFTAETLTNSIIIPFLPGRTRGVQTDPVSYPEATATFEVTARIGEVACSTVADTHRTVLNKAQLNSSTNLGYQETSGLTAPYGPGDSSDNLAEITFDIPAPTCPAYDIVTQVTESATQAADGIDEVGAYEYTVVVSNNGPDTVTDMPFFFGTHFIEAGASSFAIGTRYHPDYWANLWTLNSPTCVAAAGGVCPTGYNLTATQFVDVGSPGSPIPDGNQSTGSHDLPDTTTIIPSLSSGGTITFTFTGTSGELAKKCGIPHYVNAHAHALPLDQMGETNIDIPGSGFEGYYLKASNGWPGGNMSHGSYYGNNGFSLRTQWNTGDTGGICDGDDYDLSITMTGPFADTTSTIPMAGSLPPDTVVYYRVRVNNLDDSGLPGGIDFIDDRTEATGGFMAGFQLALDPFPWGGVEWLNLDTAFGIGEALPDHNHPLDATPGLTIDQPSGYNPGYSPEAEETSLPWAAWEGVGFDCLATTGGAECPDADDLTDYYQDFDTINAAGESGNRGAWGTSTAWNLGVWLPLKDFEGDSLHLPEGSNIDFLIPYQTPPLSKPCVPGGDTFVYNGGIFFEATVSGWIPDAYSDVISERDPDNNESSLSFQMEVPACAATLDIDKRTVIPAAVDVVPQDGVVRYEVDLTYPITAANTLDVAQFIDIPTPDCGGNSPPNPASCAQYEIINVVGCSVTSGNAVCPASIPIGQQLAQDGTLTAIPAGTIDTRWGTPNATDLAGGAAFEPGSSITIILEARLSGADTNLDGVENRAAFASDPDSSQYAGGMYAEDTELLAIESGDSMVLQKAVGPTDAQQGDIITFTLDIINNGPADGQSAYLTDIVPANLLVDNPAGYTNITCVPLATAPPLAPDFNVADCANINITNNGAAGFQIDMTGSWVMNSGYRVTFNAVAPADSLSIENTAILIPPPQSPTQRFAGVSDSTVNFRTPELLQVLVGDRVWIEDDNDGDAATGNITPVVGATVTATASDGTAYSDVTDASGNYTIPVSANNVYTVTVDRPFATAPSGILITTDSDPNTQNNLSHDGGGTVVTVGTNDNLTIDFGFTPIEPALCYVTADEVDPDDTYVYNVSLLTMVTEEHLGTGDSGRNDIEAIEYDPLTEVLYAWDRSTYGTLDLTTGAFITTTATPGTICGLQNGAYICGPSLAHGNESGGYDIDGMAANPIPDRWFVAIRVDDKNITGTMRADWLAVIDKTTGQFNVDYFGYHDPPANTQPIGFVELQPQEGLHDMDDLGYNPTTGQLYGIANISNTGVTLIVEIDPETGATINLGNIRIDNTCNNGTPNADLGDVEGLSIDYNGNIFGVVGDSLTPVTDPNNCLHDSLYYFGTVDDLQVGGGNVTATYLMAMTDSDQESLTCSNYPIVSVGDTVWLDTDSDGSQNGGESGIPGVVLNIYNSDGYLLGTQTTDSNGNYLFDGLLLDSNGYTVTVAPENFLAGGVLDGYTQTGDPDGVLDDQGISTSLTNDGDSDLSLDFGYVPPVLIGNRVWIEDDNDGDANSGNITPVVGATVTATASDGTTYTDVTDASGNYTISVPADAVYTVTVSTPAGTTPAGTLITTDSDPAAQNDLSHDGSGTVVAVGTVDNLTIDFGFYEPPPPPPCGTNPGDLGGTIWRDYNSDGIQDTNELGFNGVTVTAYDNDGNAVTTTINSDGTYNFSDIFAIETHIRLEFSGLPSWMESGTHGVNSGTTVQIHTTATCDADLAVQNPADYCQANPAVIANCMVSGDPLLGGTAGADKAIVWFDYTLSGASSSDLAGYQPPNQVVLASEVGSTWGLAYDAGTEKLYSAAYLKRHVGLGSGGLGAIYMTTGAGSGSTNTTMLTTIPNVGTISSNATRGLDGDKTQPSRDPEPFEQIGRIGLGDMDISEDGTTLYVVNLNDQQLYPVTVATGVVGMPVAVPAPSCNLGEWRPFAVATHDGQVYVGGVCTAENGGTETDLTAQVYAYDPALNSWSGGLLNNGTVYPLDYTKGCVHNSSTTNPVTNCAGWNPWENDALSLLAGPGYYDSNGRPWVIYPQPILSDIEFADDGSMILAFRDRFADQIGEFNLAPVTPLIVNGTDYGNELTWVGISGGDILRTYFNGTTHLVESGGLVGPYVSSGPGTDAFGQGGPNAPQGPGDGEFYWRDHQLDSGQHSENVHGGLAIQRGTDEILVTTYGFSVGNQGSVQWYSNSDGSRNQAYEIFGNYRTGGGTNVTDGLFSKAGGLADLVLLCDAAPLEIGNYVWFDEDSDGIQDPCEPAIAGIDVVLTADDGTTQTTTTDASGEYYFPVEPNSAYTLTIDMTQPELITATLTTPNVDAGTTLTDGIDSDAVASGNLAVITLTTGDAGENDHSFDFGFYEAPELLDLVIEKSASMTQAMPGETVTYTLAVSNVSTVDATNVVVTDTLPAGVTFISATPSQGSGCNEASGEVICDLGSLAGSGSATIDVIVTVDGTPPLARALRQRSAQAATLGYTVNIDLFDDINGNGVQDATDGLAGALAQWNFNADPCSYDGAGNLMCAGLVAPAPTYLVGAGGSVSIDSDDLYYNEANPVAPPPGAYTSRVTLTVTTSGNYIIASTNLGTKTAPNKLELGLPWPPTAGRARSASAFEDIDLTIAAEYQPTCPEGTPPSNTPVPSNYLLNVVVVSADETETTYANNQDHVCVEVLPDELFVEIGDLVWIEDDNDGLATGVITPVVGTVVTALGSDGTIYTDTTDAMGYYTITIPANEVYTVTVGTPAGTVVAVPAGGLVATDDDPTMDDDTSHDPAGTVVTVGTVDNLTIDFGFYELPPSAPSIALSKVLNTPPPARVNDVVSFTIRITNTGTTVITTVPLTDTHNSAYLTYVTASPLPDVPVQGELIWHDLTATGASGFGIDLNPGETFEIVVEFLANLDTTGLPNDSAINLADSQGITDTAEVPILAPTSVQLTNREVVYQDGNVILHWGTADEANVVGFHIYRRLAGNDDEEPKRLNPELLVAKNSGSSSGATYIYEDETAQAGMDYRYFVGILDTKGLEIQELLDNVLIQRTIDERFIFLPILMK